MVQNQRQTQMMRNQQQGMRPTANNPQIKMREQNQKPKYFVALFDYDPATMSPNPDACDEELPFSEGDTIKVWGEKDADGFYWGECRGTKKNYLKTVIEVISSRSKRFCAPQHGNGIG